ncbi:TetR/AcrR family transcriptional regulator [Novosphingobium album (ex Liu et al. 2023)]|uniref:TetR family transcriptional regulator n=1 Tax=Novosphingobium album (ex Liu et al. 2023) TaxID=3031130 RepID=A0ABT5WPB3_9SPHN|nr:TetR/AcrR family transcriptional regulator [Novosphingobium album (ex Liu et al. 2023)]MDE8651117.1 TetR family transcriptional regulator [Novosphingobium album (ex Liu et al. 2023)]
MTIRPIHPRRRDAEATRARILDAAQRAFSETGYSHTGIREIAAMAGTSSTLLLRYFGSKAGLFEAALRAAMPVSIAIAGPRERLGEDLAKALLDPANTIRPPLMIALASGDPEAAAIAARVFEEMSITPVAAWLGAPDGRARALEIAMLATGLVFYLRQLPLAALSPREQQHLTDWFAGAVKAVVEQSPKQNSAGPADGER